MHPEVTGDNASYNFMKDRIAELIFRVDKQICGQGQVPAQEYREDFPNQARELAVLRLIGMGSEVVDVALGGIETWAFFRPDTLKWFALALLARTVTRQARVVSVNKAMLIHGDMILQMTEAAEPYLSSISATLGDMGVSVAQNMSLEDLTIKLRRTELNPVGDKLRRTVLEPLAQASGMAIAGEEAAAAMVAGVGLMALPVGELLYSLYESRNRKLEHAWAAKMMDYFKKLQHEHVGQARISNMIRDIPEAVFALWYFSQGSFLAGLGVFKGVREGLNSLGSVVMWQWDRVQNVEVVKTARKFMEVLKSAPFLISEKRRRSRTFEIKSKQFSQMKEGVVIQKMRPVLPDGRQADIGCLDVEIKPGEKVVLVANSGSGKSEMMLALTDLIDHNSGEVWLVEGGRGDLVSGMTREEIEEKIRFVDRRTVRKGKTIIDVINPAFIRDSWETMQEDMRSNPVLVETAYRTDVKKLRADLSLDKPNVYPLNLRPGLQRLLNSKDEFARKALELSGGNLVGLSPFRELDTLSSGERQRLSVMATRVLVQSDASGLVILDEPLSNLDPTNKRFQLDDIDRIKVPAVIISHEDDVARLEMLSGVRVVRL